MTGRTNYGTWPLFRESTHASRLNNREPRGMKTAHIESLTSYFTGLSWSHCLSPARLFASVMAPLLNKAYLAKTHNRAAWLSRSFRARSAAINGMGRIALDWVTLLEQLTGREDVRYLTFLPWAGILSQRNLLRHRRAWCPVCIQEWDIAGKPLYEPLLWSVNLVTRCVIHEVRLIIKCPSCNAALHYLSHGGRCGYCDICGQSLAVSLERCHERSCSVDRELVLGRMIGELLANSSTLGSSIHATLSSSIASLLKDGTLKNANRFALMVGRNKSTVCGWLHGSRMPLRDLLDVSERLKTSPLKLLSGSSKLLTTDNTIYQLPKRKPDVVARKPFNRKKALAGLERISTSGSPPRSMQHLANTLNIDKRVLYRHFPQSCKKIAAQAAKHRRSKVA